MAIRFSTQSGDFKLKEEEKVKSWIAEVVNRCEKKVGNINYLFCDDKYLLNINLYYLNHDTYTDIITFDYVAGGLISGDIMISVERVAENANIFGVPFDTELKRVLIHGVLHLLGQGDKTEAGAAQMRQRENAAIALWDEMFRKEPAI